MSVSASRARVAQAELARPPHPTLRARARYLVARVVARIWGAPGSVPAPYDTCTECRRPSIVVPLYRVHGDQRWRCLRCITADRSAFASFHETRA